MAVETDVSWWGVHVVMPIAMVIGGGWVRSLATRLHRLEDTNSHQNEGLAVHGSQLDDVVSRLDRIEALVMKIAFDRRSGG